MVQATDEGSLDGEMDKGVRNGSASNQRSDGSAKERWISEQSNERAIE